MIEYPTLLVPMARKAGMDIPEDADDFEPEDYPHFHVYCEAQLGQPIWNARSHWENAKLIADLSEEEVRHITMSELLGMGLR